MFNNVYHTFELRFLRHINMIYEKNRKILTYVTYNEIGISYCQDIKCTTVSTR